MEHTVMFMNVALHKSRDPELAEVGYPFTAAWSLPITSLDDLMAEAIRKVEEYEPRISFSPEPQWKLFSDMPMSELREMFQQAELPYPF